MEVLIFLCVMLIAVIVSLCILKLFLSNFEFYDKVKTIELMVDSYDNN